jgi:hypothetical protein
MPKSPPPGAPRKPGAKTPAKPAPRKPASKAAVKSPKPKQRAAQSPLKAGLPLPGVSAPAKAAPLPGIKAPARSNRALPGVLGPAKAEAKKLSPLVPGKTFDPKGADWKNRHGHGQVSGGPPPTRPFKGGGRGR